MRRPPSLPKWILMINLSSAQEYTVMYAYFRCERSQDQNWYRSVEATQWFVSFECARVPCHKITFPSSHSLPALFCSHTTKYKIRWEKKNPISIMQEKWINLVWVVCESNNDGNKKKKKSAHAFTWSSSRDISSRLDFANWNELKTSEIQTYLFSFCETCAPVQCVNHTALAHFPFYVRLLHQTSVGYPFILFNFRFARYTYTSTPSIILCCTFNSHRQEWGRGEGGRE